MDLSCSKKTSFKKTQIDKKHLDIKRKCKEKMERVIDNASAFIH